MIFKEDREEKKKRGKKVHLSRLSDPHKFRLDMFNILINIINIIIFIIINIINNKFEKILFS